jgi:hypothetical protein
MVLILSPSLRSLNGNRGVLFPRLQLRIVDPRPRKVSFRRVCCFASGRLLSVYIGISSRKSGGISLRLVLLFINFDVLPKLMFENRSTSGWTLPASKLRVSTTLQLLLKGIAKAAILSLSSIADDFHRYLGPILMVCSPR